MRFFPSSPNFYQRITSRFVLLLLCMQASSVLAQTTLSAGDIAFVQYNADGTDDFAWVALTDIDSGTVIFFTDNEASGSGINSGEGIIEWTAPNAGISCGTIVTITTTPSATTGTVSETLDLNFSGNGDGIIAYQGTTSSATFITALGNDGSTAGDYSGTAEGSLPTGLTLGVDAQSISEIDNAIYNGAVLTGTAVDISTAIYTASNWSGDNSTNQTFSNAFSVSGCSA